MLDDYLRSIEPLIAIVLATCVEKAHRLMKCGAERGRSTKNDHNTKRRLQCPTAPKALDPAEPSVARFAMASSVSSGTTRGEPLFVPGSASIASDLAGQAT
jgi:hypothetical protein